MSIAITAPQKFDFQDIVCVEMMLRFHHLEEMNFLVEPKGGEDGEIRFGQGLPTVCAEIQVKGAAGPVTIDVIASCLAHMPPRRATDTLLERLFHDPTRLVILIVSGRCDDAASIYSVPFSWTGACHPDHRIKRSDAVKLLSAFANLQHTGSGSSSLKTKREAHCKAVADAIDPMLLRCGLQRLIVLEQIEEVELESRCADRLRMVHRIPGDRIPDVLNRLRQAVKTAKIQAIDAVPLVQAVLRNAAPPPIRPQNFVTRGDEGDWATILSSKSVLLLSGPPRIGKTDAARWVAAEFESHGYEIRETNDVDIAERFLLEPGEAQRLVVLDDPLGGVHVVPDAARRLSRIEGLIQRSQPKRKIIISQGQEHLLATSRQSELSEVRTGNQAWVDLGIMPPGFLSRLWQQISRRWSVPQPLDEIVLEALKRGVLSLEAGCLYHLAINYACLKGRYNIDRIRRLARQDAASLGHALEEDGFQQILTGLVLASSESEPIAYSELSFVMGSGGDGLPGKPKTLGICYSWGGNDDTRSLDRSYDSPPVLAPEEDERLEKLERRRIVEIDGEGRVSFTHPFYRSSAESILGRPTRNATKKILTIVMRGLFCLEPSTTRATARNLDWVYDVLASQLKAQEELLDYAVSGLTSYFPTTRDLCFTFLLRRLPQLTHDRQMELPQWVNAVASVSLDSLEWINGDARLPLDKTLSLWDRHHDVSKEMVTAELSILEGAQGGYLSPERAAKILKYYRKAPATISPRAMARLLSYDEAAIRAEAVKLWFEVPRAHDEALLQRIFAEDHPSIALEAVRGSITGYKNWPSARRKVILAGLQTLATLPASAAAILDRLVVFDRVEYTGDDPPWEIFETLLPHVMRALPENAAFIDARLFAVAETARTVLPASSMVSICDGWIDWLERNAIAGRLPSEFSLGVANILLQTTKADPSLRTGRIQRLLNFPGTGALLPFLADIIDEWDDLTKEERVIVENILTSMRSNVRWLQAVVLTRSQVPKVLQRRILGEGLTLESDPGTLLTTMEQELLSALVHVYSGMPQPLWWLGTHHGCKPRWEPIIEMIASTPSHPLFDLAWRHIAYGGKGKRVAKVIKSVGLQDAERMLDLLIRIKVGCTGDFMPDAWSALLELAPDVKTRSRWISKISEYAQAIFEGLSDIWLLLKDGDDIKVMLELLTTDTMPLRYIDIVSKELDGAANEEIKAATTDLVGTMFEKFPPRLYRTCDQVLERLNQLKINDRDLARQVGSRRTEILAEVKTIEKSCEFLDGPIEGWLDP